MQSTSYKLIFISSCLFLFLGLFLFPQKTFADTGGDVISEGYYFDYSFNDSIYGRENGPINYIYTTFAPAFSVLGASTSWAMDQYPRIRDILYDNGYGGPTTGTGFSYLTMTAQDDGNGLEDSTWRTALCDGPYLNVTSILGDTNTRKCWNVFAVAGLQQDWYDESYPPQSHLKVTLIQYGGPTLTPSISPNAIGNEGLTHSPISPITLHENDYKLGWYMRDNRNPEGGYYNNNGRDSLTGAITYPSLVIAPSFSNHTSIYDPTLWWNNGNRDFVVFWDFFGPGGPHLNNWPHVGVVNGGPADDKLGSVSPLGELRISEHSCTPKYVCSNSTTLAYRNAQCEYSYVSTCSLCGTVGGQGVCNPAPNTPAHASPYQITPVTVDDSFYGPTITSSETPTLQCIPFQKWVNYTTDQEEYFVDDVYKVNIHIPEAAVPPSGYWGFLSWTALDNADATQKNQLGLQWPRTSTYDPLYDYWSNNPYSVVNPAQYVNSNFSTFVRYEGQFWDESTRTLKAPLFPTSENINSGFGGTYSFLVYFKNQQEAETNWYGAFGRGNSFVTQFQPYYDTNFYSNTYYVDRPGYNSTLLNSPQVGYPLVYHYTLPTYAQCAPPAEIAPTIQKTTMTCSDSTNTISWSPVAGADQYKVLVRKYYPGEGNDWWFQFDMPDYEGSITATTTSTSYSWAAPAANGYVGERDWQVRVYAHNSNGWNISNEPAYFKIANCSNSCRGPDDVIIANGNSRTYYASTTGACVGISRLCTNGTLSGSSTYRYGYCFKDCAAPDGSGMLNSGSGNDYFNSTTSPCTSQYRSCSNGTMTGNTTYRYNSCTYTSCIGGDGSEVPVGTTKRYYATQDPGYCDQYTDLTCTINGWDFPYSDSYIYPSCPGDPGTCTLDGIVMNDGQTKKFYESTAPCTPAYLTCDGATHILSGGLAGKTYVKNNSCIVDNSCHSPDGITTPNGGIRTFYESANPNPTCIGHNQTCVNGSFSPNTYTITSCGASNTVINRFTADPTIIRVGGTTTLTLTAKDATGGCVISGKNINPTGPNTDIKEVIQASTSTVGMTTVTVTTGALDSSEKYRCQCTDDNGTQVKYTTVIVDPTIKER